MPGIDARGPMRVLLVEDEGVIAMLVEDLLAAMGHVVVASAARLDAAMAEAVRPDLDLAVLDVNLAGELSYPVAMVLRGRGVPFVFAIGYGLAALPAALADVPVVAKPFGEVELARAIGAARAERG